MSQLPGIELRRAFRGAVSWLEEHRDTINALNVFPVPDGDTGTNMLLTMRAAMERCPSDDVASASEVASGVAQGAFLGARGNSGVILSQFFRGFSEALDGKATFSGPDLAQALDQAREAAYRAVSQPVEGTMLTVIRRASEAALDRAVGPEDREVADVLATAFHASCDALRRTPEQLPVLREAGVVDSGGLGIVAIIGGACRALAPGAADGGLDELVNGSLASLVEGRAQGRLATRSGYLDTTVDVEWGYCTEFIIKGEGLDPEAVRSEYEKTALSTVVAGDERQVRVHIHAEDPGPALSYAVSLGQLSNIKIENMDEQNAGFAADRDAPALDVPAPRLEAADLAVVAVTTGDGIAELFLDSGARGVAVGGQTMNPSVEELLQAAEKANGRNTIILPNNKNIVLTARQAAETDPSLHVVPSQSIPAGVTALLAYNPEQPLEANLAAMEESLAEVKSVEVTQAVRDSRIGGVVVGAGDYIGLVDDALVATAGSAEDALQAALEQAGIGPDSIVTLYRGWDADETLAEGFVRSLERQALGVQVDLIYGGQPHYDYLASVE